MPFKKNNKPWNKGIKGIHLSPATEFKKGVRTSPKTEFKKCPENKHPRWKGDSVGYGALHDWIRKHLGTPKFCEECGNRSLRHRQYHWANISGKYIRDLNDWRRLCVKCHSKLDKNR